MIQMISVRDVSIVALCAAEATLVVVMPQTLKQAMDTIIPSESQMMVQLSYICANAYEEFSRYPKLHSLERPSEPEQ